MKTVLITGANRSIGFETARQLVQKGYYVYLGARELSRGQKAVDALKAEGHEHIEALEIDVDNLAYIQSARQILGEKIQVLDVLINNAGIPGAYPQTAEAAPVSVVRQVFETNFFGVIEVTQAFWIC